jgi:hypothetical protein
MRLRADSISFAAAAGRVSAGIVIWAAHFGAIYGYTGLACARRFSDSGAAWVALVPWVIGAATLLAVAAALVFLAPVVRSPRAAPFVDWLGGWVAALAIVAIVLEAMAMFWVSVCG